MPTVLNQGQSDSAVLRVGTGPKRDAVIQGLRGLVMSFVFFSHFGDVMGVRNWAGPALRGFFSALSSLHLGGCTFLLITSYYVYRRFDSGQDTLWRPFLKRRLFRILPLYWTILTVYVVCSIGLQVYAKVPGASGMAIRKIAANALMIAPLLGDRAIITASWTLTYILLAYCTVPGFASLASGRTGRARIGLILAAGCLWQTGTFLYDGFSPCGIMIPAGLLVWEARKSAAFQRRLARLGEAGTLAILAAGLSLKVTADSGRIPLEHHLADILGQIAFVAGIGAFCAYRFSREGPINRLLMRPLPNRLGNMSFSYYLCHGAAIAVAVRVCGAFLPPDWHYVRFFCLLPLAYAISIAVAAVIFEFVEAPLSRLGYQWATGTRAETGRRLERGLPPMARTANV